MDITKQPHKVEGNQVLWFNGEKWLVRETLKTNKQAVEKLEELCPTKL